MRINFSVQKICSFLCLFLMFVGLQAATVVEIVEKCQPSVVQIRTLDKLGKVVGCGSGFVIAPELVATCYHVIDGAKDADIKTTDKIVYPVTSVVAYDQAHDLAILRVNKLNLPPLELANSDAVKLGEKAIAIGSPLGLEGASVSDGIVSAMREYEDFGQVVQVSTPISPGNSGGPLINDNCQVIGIVSFTRIDGQNINFGIVANALRELRTKETQQECTLKELFSPSATGKSPTGSQSAYGYLAPITGYMDSVIPMKAPYTVYPFGLLEVDPATIAVTQIVKQKGNKESYIPSIRITSEAELRKSSFFVTDAGVLKFSSADAGRTIMVSFTYRPQRVAIWASNNSLEYVASMVRMAGYEPVTGAEVNSALSRMINQGEENTRNIAQTLDCSYLLTYGYNIEITDTTWSSRNQMYLQWLITVDTSLTMRNLNTGTTPINSKNNMQDRVGKLAKVDHAKHGIVMVQLCLSDSWEKQVVFRK